MGANYSLLPVMYGAWVPQLGLRLPVRNYGVTLNKKEFGWIPDGTGHKFLVFMQRLSTLWHSSMESISNIITHCMTSYQMQYTFFKNTQLQFLLWYKRMHIETTAVHHKIPPSKNFESKKGHHILISTHSNNISMVYATVTQKCNLWEKQYRIWLLTTS